MERRNPFEALPHEQCVLLRLGIISGAFSAGTEARPFVEFNGASVGSTDFEAHLAFLQSFRRAAIPRRAPCTAPELAGGEQATSAAPPAPLCCYRHIFQLTFPRLKDRGKGSESDHRFPSMLLIFGLPRCRRLAGGLQTRNEDSLCLQFRRTRLAIEKSVIGCARPLRATPRILCQ